MDSRVSALEPGTSGAGKSHGVDVLVAGIKEAPHVGGIFLRSLEELGYSVAFADENDAFGLLDRPPLRSIVWRLNGMMPTRIGRFNQNLLDTALRTRPRAIISVKGSYIFPETLRSIRSRTGAVLINYSTDDPFNPASSNRHILNSLPLWDIYATPRPHLIPELSQHSGARMVSLPWAFDPSLHFPEEFVSEEERMRYECDVVFIGVCDQDRLPMLEMLAARDDIRVRLYGGGRYKYSRILRRRHHGFAVGREYRCVLKGAKIALSLNRLGNRDTHVMRTFEIPACGTFMLAERSEDQRAFFKEDREAAYFADGAEMMRKIDRYLAREDDRQAIARNGYVQATTGGHTYTERLRTLMGAASLPAG